MKKILSESHRSKISATMKRKWAEGSFDFHYQGKPLSELVSKRSIRKKLYLERGRKCEKCGWAEVNPHGKIPVEINHKNGNHKDWRDENLEILCPNCHSLTDHFKFYGKTHGNKSKRCTNKRYLEGLTPVGAGPGLENQKL